jgi:hypothetical protein
MQVICLVGEVRGVFFFSRGRIIRDSNKKKKLRKQSKIRKADLVNEHHAMKTYRGNGSKAPGIINHCIKFL